MSAAPFSVEPQPWREAAIIGCACRLPGARDEASFWSLLERGDCAVTRIPAERWSHQRFLHPGRGVAGRAYSFDAGVLDDIFGFDAAAFGLSPREVEQIDPQQRLLLELVREAFEDANLPLSRLAGAPVGVFVGASSLDHSLHFVADIAAADAHFVTGNALSIIANRISHVFGFTGPSLAIDTACSSSLVAFDRAVRAIEAGEIETAIVAGVNVLASPFNFIGFSRAGMLSPTGRCRPFSGAADGYVRAEGGVVTLLTRLEGTRTAGLQPRAVVVATGTNSDGRTLGIAMPESRAQQRLLEELYAARGIDPDRLAFIEAHGTGTLVGDPAEANAVGAALGRRRAAPLPIGSVKSNIGHLEPASGLAGLLKALMALERRQLPASLHLDTLNGAIDFAGLNLAPASAPVALDPAARLAGISSFGFGGTNAHAVIRLPEPDELPPPLPTPSARVLVLSANGPDALSELAEIYAARLDAVAADSPEDVAADRARLAHAAAHGRARLPHRLALPIDGPDAPARLRALARGETGHALLRGAAPAGTEPAGIAFVFSGNGGQYPGMGQAAWQASAPFRRAVEEIDDIFTTVADWSLADAFRAPPDETALAATEIAQPLIFALEVATARALMEAGCQPAAVIGHSVGEVAAAHIAGALSLFDATQLIYWRSRLQAETRGAGTMAFLMTGAESAQALIAAAAQPDVVIAAHNAPTGVTLSGPGAAVEAVLRLARRQGIVGKKLGIDYPFHSPAMAPLEQPTLQALSLLEPRAPTLPFISTLTGAPVTDASLGARYWWDNIRQPVAFEAGMRHLARLHGLGIFLEIGPRPVLTGFVREILAAQNRPGVVLPSLQDKDRPEEDPIERTLLAALVNGARVDEERLFGPARLPGRLTLPRTPWNRQPILPPRTAQAVDIIGAGVAEHPLLGARLLEDGREWRGTLDLESRPFLADHAVGDSVIVPATALAEMALAAGAAVHGTVQLRLEEFDLLAALRLAPGERVETRVRLAADGGLTIASRAVDGQDWNLHARGRVLPDDIPLATHSEATAVNDAGSAGDGTAPDLTLDAEAVYARASALGLNYGPAFRLVRQAVRWAGSGDTPTGTPPGVTQGAPQGATQGICIRLDLAADATGPAADDAGAQPGGDANKSLAGGLYVLAPRHADAALHGLVLAAEHAPPGTAFVPVRFGAVRIAATGTPARARLWVRRASARSLDLDVDLMDAEGRRLARFEAVRLRALALSNADDLGAGFRQSLVAVGPATSTAATRLSGFLESFRAPAMEDDALLTDALAYSIAHRAVLAVAAPEAQADEPVRLDPLISSGRLPAERRALFATLLDLTEEAGLARRVADGWRVQPVSDLPAPEPLLQEIATLAPDRAAELAIGARLASDLADLIGQTAPIVHHTGLIDHWESSSAAARALAGQALALVSACAGTAPDAPPLSVLLVERHGTTLEVLKHLCDAGRLRLAVLPADASARPRLADRLRPTARLTLVDQASTGEYDLILHADPRLAFAPSGEFGTRPMAALRPGGCLAALRIAPTGFAQLVTLGAPASGPGHGTVHRLAGTRGSTDVTLFPAPEVAEGNNAHAPALVALLAADAESCTISPRGHELDAEVSTIPDAYFHVHRLTAEDNAASMARALDRAGKVLERLRASTAPPALRFLVDGDPLGAHPRAAAFWAFGRTAMNEYPDLDIKLVSLHRRLIDSAAAQDLTRACFGLPRERELILDDNGLMAIRLEPVAPTVAGDSMATPASAPAPMGHRLTLDRPGSLDRLRWRPVQRRAPGAHEVEIEIAASALNFRDVMFAQGLIGDEMLEHGFAGPGIGFEAAGRIVRVGEAVTKHHVGHRVMAFAPEALATHVTIPAEATLPMPAGLTAEAAATLPVAFLTSWYALVECARLRAGETVLVHGAAGGVGLAAIQIARAHGARVLASAGSPEKRALARLFGADEIYDSRSPAFAEAIRASGGADVVLNSLAGRAMELSLSTLKPFGRFVELGKRDFIANAALGLRPFARNLSYFGVDADQLIKARPELVREMLEQLSARFADGTLRPLPHRVYAATDARAAFRLMQASGHVGKIIVTPPASPAEPAGASPFAARADGVHIVVGGTGGFGREAARWLAARGARHIVLASRTGVITPPLALDGVEIAGARLDVRDAQQCQAFIARQTSRYGRIAGIIHTAMVLDDALIRDLTLERTEAVLAPKIDGARNLDAATADLPLDYFVLFSSATTLIGNPGQAAYVAANGYLEGLARRRRLRGRPALAMAWGAIGDVGVLARNGAVSEKLTRRLGLGLLTAADALDALGHALAAPVSEPVQVHAPIDWRAGQELVVMAGATFDPLRPDEGERGDGADSADLATRLAGLGDAQARETTTRLLAGEVARILRLPLTAIDPLRPLADLGMDSLMALELDMEMQRRHHVSLPTLGLGAGATLQDIADRLLKQLRPTAEPSGAAPILAPRLAASAAGADLVDRHLRIEPAAVEALQARLATEIRRDGSVLR